MTFVTLVTNGNRNTVPAASTKTPREILTENGVDFSAAQATLDGTILTPDKLNMSLTALGVGDACYITVVAKHDSAR